MNRRHMYPLFSISVFFLAFGATYGSYAKSKCPPGFVLIPKNSQYVESDFCVSKYEMKSNNRRYLSTWSGKPVNALSHKKSIEACSSLGKDFHLITNGEWQTIARNIESVPQNWAESKIGSYLGISRGHTDGRPLGELPASPDDDKGCYLTGEKCDSNLWNSQRRTHVLSNGEVIWDFSGNLWERVADTLQNITYIGDDAYISEISLKSHPKSLILFDGVSRVVKDLFGPSGEYWMKYSDHHYGLGHAWLSLSSGVIARGGRWMDSFSAGVFATNLIFSDIESDNPKDLAFRCSVNLEKKR